MVLLRGQPPGRRESAANEHVVCLAQVVRVNQQIDIAHGPEMRTGIRELRERGALQQQQPHARSIHRDQHLGDDPRPHCAGMRVLQASGAQPIEDVRIRCESGRSKMRRDERFETVVLRGIGECTRRQCPERLGQPSFDETMAGPLRAQRQRLEYGAARSHDTDAMSRRAAACASPRSLLSAVARSTAWRSIGIVRSGG